MLGDLLARLEEPGIAGAALAAIGDRDLEKELAVRAEAERRTVAELAAERVRDWLEVADDEAWLQLMAIMGRERDPGLAALAAILRRQAAHRSSGEG